MENDQYHVPVLLEAVIRYLRPSRNTKFIDATMGGGGHTRALAELGAEVLAIDQDDDAIRQSALWQPQFPTVVVAKGNFEHLGQLANENGFSAVDGVLFDLGVSSHQLDTGERGFSFQKEAPLDMRMSSDLAVSAQDLIAALGEKELTTLFERYGEEPFAKRIARAIVERRKQEPITTTVQLASLIESTVAPTSSRLRGAGKSGGIHPATRVFQALRIAVNDEIEVLKTGLSQAFDLLAQNGRVAVISFHSLEDRVVKQQFGAWEKQNKGQSLTKKPVEASEKEQMTNRRSRSAKMRIFEKQ